jgi:hypothetical protein
MPGDIIEEASKWDHHTIRSLLGRRVLVEVPKGEWVYVTTWKWPGVDGRVEGDVVDDKNILEDDRMISVLLENGYMRRVDRPKKKKKSKTQAML